MHVATHRAVSRLPLSLSLEGSENYAGRRKQKQRRSLLLAGIDRVTRGKWLVKKIGEDRMSPETERESFLASPATTRSLRREAAR